MENALEVLYLKEHEESPAVIVDEAGVDRLVDALVSGPPSRNTAQVFSTARPRLRLDNFDHELLVGVSAKRSVGIMTFNDAAVENVVTVGTTESHDRVSYYLIGQHSRPEARYRLL